MPDEPTIPNATCPPFAGASARDLLAGILLASGGDPANIPNTTQCREWGYGRYTERDLLAAILLATGTGASVTWGSITGTLSDQTDLQTALNAKLNLTGGTLSGALNFSGTTHAGLRLNNLTTVERNAVASPLAGMVLWNTTTSRMNVHNGSAWTDGFVRLAGDTMTGALGISMGTIVSSTPILNLSQTWNNVATTFTGILANITDTASSASSLLMDLQQGGVTVASIPKGVGSGGSGGGIRFRNGGGAVIGVRFRDIAMQFIADSGIEVGEVYGSGWRIGNRALEFGSSTTAPDLLLVRDAAQTLAIRNGTNAQTFRVYGTFTDASNHRRINLSISSAGVAVLRAEGAGTGASGNVLHISSLPTSNPGPNILWNNSGVPAIGT